MKCYCNCLYLIKSDTTCSLAPENIVISEEIALHLITRTKLRSKTNSISTVIGDGWEEVENPSYSDVAVDKIKTRKRSIAKNICTTVTYKQTLGSTNFFPVSLNGSTVKQIMSMSIGINSEDPLARVASAIENPLIQKKLTTNLNSNLNLGLFELVSFVETLKPINNQTFTDGFLLHNRIIARKVFSPIRKTLIDDANRRLLANPLTAKLPPLPMDDILLTKMRVQVSSKMIGRLYVTTLTAFLDAPFNSSIILTLSEDTSALISSSSPYMTTINSQYGDEILTDTESIRLINKTETSKTISWTNWKVSNMYPIFISKTVVSPIAINMSISATDPLVSFPGATLVPWNGTLLNELKSQFQATLSQLQSYAQTKKNDGVTDFYTETSFMKIFNCSASKAMDSKIALILDDANIRLENNPATSHYPKLTDAGGKRIYSSNSKTIGNMNVVTFTSTHTTDLFSLSFSIGFVDVTPSPLLTRSVNVPDDSLDY